MDAIEKEYEKVIKKQRTSTDLTFSNIDKLILVLETAQDTLSKQAKSESTGASSASSIVMMENMAKKVKDLSGQTAECQKDFYNTLGKFTKWLDKQKYFRTDLNDIWDPQAFVGKEDMIYDTLATHFIREGRFDCWEVFVKEAGLVNTHHLELKEKFAEMYRISEALKNNDLKPAISWARAHRAELQARGSTLEFEMHRAQFITLLVSGNSDSALKYGKEHFGDFSKQFAKEIQRLMCSFLFKNRLEHSPYADFLNTNLHSDIQRHFNRDFSLLLGLSPDSPLYLSIMIGTCALPTMIKMSSIMKGKAGLEWTQQGELPVEIPLLESQRYHSVFACPVSKEQGTEENPPMMMACGHIISKESLGRLSKGASNTRFKCPYCPMESTAAQAIRVYF